MSGFGEINPETNRVPKDDIQAEATASVAYSPRLRADRFRPCRPGPAGLEARQDEGQGYGHRRQDHEGDVIRLPRKILRLPSEIVIACLKDCSIMPPSTRESTSGATGCRTCRRHSDDAEKQHQ